MPNALAPALTPRKRRGPPLLSERDPEKWKLYLLIYEDYAAHPRERTATKLLERLKTDPAVLALCGGKFSRDKVLAWEKHFKDGRSQYPAEAPRDDPLMD